MRSCCYLNGKRFDRDYEDFVKWSKQNSQKQEVLDAGKRDSS